MSLNQENKNSLSSILRSIQSEKVAEQPFSSFRVYANYFFFFFVLFTIIPIDPYFYQKIFALNWLKFHFHYLFDLVQYFPTFGFSNANIGLAIIITFSILGSLFLANKRKEEHQRYQVFEYWVRVLVRYKLASVLIVYGLLKIYNQQLPYPSLSNLLTHYGDFYPWKVYFQTLAITPKYQSLIGIIELSFGVLLLFRKTVALSAGMIIGFLSNVVAVNLFYELGDFSFTLYLLVLAVYLFSYDVPRIYSLLIKEDFTRANKFIPIFSNPILVKYKRVLLSLYTLFFLLFIGSIHYISRNEFYKYPKTAGLPNSFGLYNVEEFIVNGDTIPYAHLDSNRWENVVFEKWSTISILNNKKVVIEQSNGDVVTDQDFDRKYELAGNVGRHYYHYDVSQNKIILRNKNSHHLYDNYEFNLQRPDSNTFLLEGLNAEGDSLRVKLVKLNPKFLMYEGRRKEVAL